MPSVKMPKKSTDTDMTPFVDVAFLILSFFMLATKFKPPEPVEVTTPYSVSSDKLKESDAMWITIDKDSRVFFSVTSKNTNDGTFKSVAEGINTDRQLGLSPTDVNNLANSLKLGSLIGVPLSNLKQLMQYTPKDQAGVKQQGIPVLDSATNELVSWIAVAKQAFVGKKALILIKGDGLSKYPTFGGVVDALKRNDELKYNLITSPEDAPPGSALQQNRLKEQQAK
jgi:biopolymer transport protein ExbD